MRHPIRALFALLLLTLLAPAAPVPKGLKKKPVDDKESLVGIWMAAPGTRDENFEFTADGKMRAWMGKAGPGGTAFSYSWTIDPTGEPKQMTWGTAGAPGSVQFECVYELDGDRLRIAYNNAGKRPGAVAAGAGGGMHYSDLVRDPPAK